MNRNFKTLKGYVSAFDGYGKPRINWQEMYKLFPNFEFEPMRTFGEYENFGKAFEHKDMSMKVTDSEGHVCHITY